MVVLGFELTASYVLAILLLKQCLQHFLLYFWGRVLLFARPAWTVIFLFMLPTKAGMTGVHHHAQLLADMGSQELSAWGGLELLSSSVLPSE
jgi:hypothetical protein